jgi:hypothetical protein
MVGCMGSLAGAQRRSFLIAFISGEVTRYQSAILAKASMATISKDISIKNEAPETRSLAEMPQAMNVGAPTSSKKTTCPHTELPAHLKHLININYA